VLLDCQFYIIVGVLLCSIEVPSIIRKNLPERLSDGQTALEILHQLRVPSAIVLSTNRVLVDLAEVGYHIPQNLHPVLGVRWRGGSKVFHTILAFANLQSDLLHYVWKELLDMGEQDLCQLF
jgi:hypothetical protein